MRLKLKEIFTKKGFVIESENLKDPHLTERGVILNYTLFSCIYEKQMRAVVQYRGYLDNSIPQESISVSLSLRGAKEEKVFNKQEFDKILNFIESFWIDGNKDFYR
jgi:hypothetical protein